MCLKLLLILVTGTDNVSQNILLEYIMINSLFNSFVRLLSDPILRNQHGEYMIKPIFFYLIIFRFYELY